MSVRLDSEREVEMHFASPLLHGLGYSYEHEAVGFRFDMWEGVTRRRIEADLVYFADEHHSLADGVPLVLVEAKGSDQAPDAGTGQAKSYAYWLKPAYYVTTNFPTGIGIRAGISTAWKIGNHGRVRAGPTYELVRSALYR